ncbi:ubiquitin carboxyl-terminal hydrolase [Histoplasma capsulatum H143]|uniref:ubiquitinyl hydrolase 1 n=1 Tax=Ajellomyces capsulatus (strain H143) TaxID=544712 RepID=C6HRW0_AJECH|nr:ubiquitin carboxyl-terminal hydrolase [Histoplasma capsulatum H143]
MATIPVIVKHQGKRHEVDLDPTANGETFKFQLYSLTGVEPERQKVLVKGGQLKDDTELSTLNAKPGQTFMMLGTPSASNISAALEKPKETTKFIEDMTEAEAARADARPLRVYKIWDLYKRMSETQEGFPPISFLNSLRHAFPQFAQRAKEGPGYAQQDAEEAWSQIISQLRQDLKTKGENGDESSEIAFVDKYLAGRLESILECDDPAAKEAGETTIETSDSFLKLDCHIDKNINHLRDGLLAGLEEKIEKKSPTLNRDATYTKRSKISRLPKYLTVHFVRFFWKRDKQKKVKIMRRVTFPPELDVVEFCTDELREKLFPVRDKVREIRKDERDMERVRKRQKIAHKREEEQKANTSMVEPIQKKQIAKEDPDATTDVAMEEAFKTDAEYESERAAAVMAAKKELFDLIDPKLASDDGANTSGLEEGLSMTLLLPAARDTRMMAVVVVQR